MLWDETHVEKVVGSNPGTFSHIFAVKIVMFVCKDEIKQKRGWGLPIYVKKVRFLLLTKNGNVLI